MRISNECKSLIMKSSNLVKLAMVLYIILYIICFPCLFIECLKQHSAHPHKVDHQLGSARYRVFRSFKPMTLRAADQ